MAVIYTAYQSFPAGNLRVSASDDAITGIEFYHDDAPRTDQQHTSFPRVMHQCMDELQAYFAGEKQVFDFPVLQEGTAFQQKVWKELMVIPFGVTISYLELAKRLGDLKVIRAAASANGKNKLSIVVPCHRVIGSNQDLVGYAGGIGMKKWLLQHEAKIAHGVQTLF
jgi:methylated-DNA-[protein]-cysteine S-methyltransferase